MLNAAGAWVNIVLGTQRLLGFGWTSTRTPAGS